jgi:hypothetical protein
MGERPDGSLPDRYGTPTSCKLVMVDNLPTAADGQVDRERLAHAGQTDDTSAAEGSEPATDLQRAIANIWCQTLERNRIGIQENFFELGGHSMHATQILARLHTTLGIELTLTALFDDPTIAQLAARIEQADHRPAEDTLQV